MVQRPPRQLLISVVACCLPLAAQDPAAEAQLQPIDAVRATVNDAVILQSEVETLAAGRIRAAEQEYKRPLSPPERATYLRAALERLIDQHALAQAAKTLGIFPPDRVEAELQDRLREEEKEQIRELGTLQKLTEERRRQSQNSTWQAIQREQRVVKLAQLTQEMAVGLRLQNQTNLFITPRMMRDYYRHHRELFVHGSRSLLGAVRVSGADAPAVAAEIAELWRRQDLTPEDIVERFGARGAFLPERLVLDDQSRKVRRADQVEFALAGPKGNVEAAPDGQNQHVWKVLDFVPSSNQAFDDPEVQRQIRGQMEHDVIDQLLQQVTDRARQRTEVWFLGG